MFTLRSRSSVLNTWQDRGPTLTHRWANVADVGPTMNRRWWKYLRVNYSWACESANWTIAGRSYEEGLEPGGVKGMPQG